MSDLMWKRKHMSCHKQSLFMLSRTYMVFFIHCNLLLISLRTQTSSTRCLPVKLRTRKFSEHRWYGENEQSDNVWISCGWIDQISVTLLIHLYRFCVCCFFSCPFASAAVAAFLIYARSKKMEINIKMIWSYATRGDDVEPSEIVCPEKKARERPKDVIVKIEIICKLMPASVFH